MASETFAPDKKQDWHKDPSGQILRHYERHRLLPGKGKPKQFVRKGDVIKFPPAG